MKLGIISRELQANGAADLFLKTANYDFSLMQLNLKSLTKEEMPDHIPDALNREIADEAAKNKIEILAVNGTFNMCHPDPLVRRDGISRFEKIASTCNVYGCNLITLCTGSRNLDSMWSPHPDNNTDQAWKDMIKTMEELIPISEKYNVFLGIEPEASNVVNSPVKAKKLIEEMKSSRLKIVLDGANLFQEGMAKRENVRPVISRAIELLAPWIILAHGKDIKEGEGINFTCPGRGIIDFEFFLRELDGIGYKGGMIIHGIKDEKDMSFCRDHIKNINGKH